MRKIPYVIQPFPYAEIEENEAQRGDAAPTAAGLAADVRPGMPTGTTVRIVSTICFALAGTALTLAGGLLCSHGFLGSKPLPSPCWREMAIGIGLFILGGFFIWHGMSDHEKRRR